MDTHTFWTTVGLIATALLVTTPLAHRALHGNPRTRPGLFVSGGLATLSFTIGPGAAAALLTLPWFCLGIGLVTSELRSTSLRRQLPRLPMFAAQPAITWIWMVAGACWLTAHRLGSEPLGFDRAITLFTVAHFHVAGLGLTALLAATHRRLTTRPLLAAISLHQLGMLTVATGLTFNDHLEVVGAGMITAALGIWAVSVARWTTSQLVGRARLMLGLASIAWVLPMALAFGWALAPLLPHPVVTTFTTMLQYHAAIQTFGLVMCGLTGLIAAERDGAGPKRTALPTHSNPHQPTGGPPCCGSTAPTMKRSPS